MRPLERPRYSWRDDPAVPGFDETRILVVVDGACGLCSATARRIARLDRGDHVRICTAQSALGRALMTHFGLSPDDPDSWMMIRNGKAQGTLDAAITLFPLLDRRYAPLRILRVLPDRLLDWAYARVARNRYRVFGRTEVCALPDEALRRRLVG